MLSRLIIFEGIASSGKTTLERILSAQLKDAFFISEEETLMPLIQNTDPEIAFNHLMAVLGAMETQSTKTFIIDRFHLTHAFRTKASLSFFRRIETRLRKRYKPVVVLLTMKKRVIADRIKETIMRRGSRWAKGKRGSFEEKVAYYMDQQRALSALAKHSTLPVLRIDTTDKDWSRCASEILQTFV